MDGTARRQAIIEILSSSPAPVPGGALAKQLGTSRQVIVQDIALLRAGKESILATSRGYWLEPKSVCSRIFTVRHSNQQIGDELNTIVDCGGRVRNVMIAHRIYGKIQAELSIGCRKEVDAFVEEVSRQAVRPLNELTDGIHSHCVEADTEEVLDEVEAQLCKKGYLVK